MVIGDLVRLFGLPAVGPFLLHRLAATAAVTSPDALDGVNEGALSRTAMSTDPAEGAKDQSKKGHGVIMGLEA